MKIVNVRGLRPGTPGIVYCGRGSGGWIEHPLLHNKHNTMYPCRVIACINKLSHYTHRVCRRGPIHSVTEAIQLFRTDLHKRITSGDTELLNYLYNLPDCATLGCWCVEKDEGEIVRGKEECHCEVIILASRWLQKLVKEGREKGLSEKNTDAEIMKILGLKL